MAVATPRKTYSEGGGASSGHSGGSGGRQLKSMEVQETRTTEREDAPGAPPPAGGGSATGGEQGAQASERRAVSGFGEGPRHAAQLRSQCQPPSGRPTPPPASAMEKWSGTASEEGGAAPAAAGACYGCVWGRRWRKEGCGTHPEPSHRQRRSSATGSATGALGPRPRRAPGRLCLVPAVRTQPHRTRQRRRKVTASRHARPRRTRRRCTAAHRSLRDRAQGARTGWVSSQRTWEV